MERRENKQKRLCLHLRILDAKYSQSEMIRRERGREETKEKEEREEEMRGSSPKQVFCDCSRCSSVN